jgi:hypothetical protein
MNKRLIIFIVVLLLLSGVFIYSKKLQEKITIIAPEQEVLNNEASYSFSSVGELFKDINKLDGKTITVTGDLGYPDICADGENLGELYAKHFCKGDIELDDNIHDGIAPSIKLLDKVGIPYTHASRGTCDSTCNSFPYQGRRFTLIGKLAKNYPVGFEGNVDMAYWALTVQNIKPDILYLEGIKVKSVSFIELNKPSQLNLKYIDIVYENPASKKEDKITLGIDKLLIGSKTISNSKLGTYSFGGLVQAPTPTFKYEVYIGGDNTYASYDNVNHIWSDGYKTFKTKNNLVVHTVGQGDGGYSGDAYLIEIPNKNIWLSITTGYDGTSVHDLGMTDDPEYKDFLQVRPLIESIQVIE